MAAIKKIMKIKYSSVFFYYYLSVFYQNESYQKKHI